MTGNHNHARNAEVSILTAVPDGPDEGNSLGVAHVAGGAGRPA
jgi:hypothetical protein